MSESIVNITTRQVAKIAGVDPSTVRRWADNNELPYVKTPGGQYRFPEAQILSRFAAHPEAPALSSTPELDESAGAFARPGA